MLIKLNDYFHSAIKKPVYLCSTLLDPRVKTSQLTSEVLSLIGLDKVEILAIFKCEAEKFVVTSKYAATEERITSKNAISNSLYKKKKQRITSLDEEIDQYLNAECEEEAHQPLAFWKANSERFPSLSNMARTYLAVPASSAPCKRAFSVGRHIQTSTRNRMSIKTLESLICLKDWVNHNIIDINNVNNCN